MMIKLFYKKDTTEIQIASFKNLLFLKFFMISTILFIFTEQGTFASNCITGTTVTPSVDHSFCKGVTATPLTNTITKSESGTRQHYSIKWYYNSTNSNNLEGATHVQTTNNLNTVSLSTSTFTPSTSTVGTRYYFAQITITSTLTECSSNTFTSGTVKVVVNPLPAAPTGSASQTFHDGDKVANLSATGTAVKWYTASINKIALPSSTALINNTHYYASQTMNGCESSARLNVTAIKNSDTIDTKK